MENIVTTRNVNANTQRAIDSNTESTEAPLFIVAVIICILLCFMLVICVLIYMKIRKNKMRKKRDNEQDTASTDTSPANTPSTNIDIECVTNIPNLPSIQKSYTLTQPGAVKESSVISRSLNRAETNKYVEGHNVIKVNYAVMHNMDDKLMVIAESFDGDDNDAKILDSNDTENMYDDQKRTGSDSDDMYNDQKKTVTTKGGVDTDGNNIYHDHKKGRVTKKSDDVDTDCDDDIKCIELEDNTESASSDEMYENPEKIENENNLCCSITTTTTDGQTLKKANIPYIATKQPIRYNV